MREIVRIGALTVFDEPDKELLSKFKECSLNVMRWVSSRLPGAAIMSDNVTSDGMLVTLWIFSKDKLPEDIVWYLFDDMNKILTKDGDRISDYGDIDYCSALVADRESFSVCQREVVITAYNGNIYGGVVEQWQD